MKKQISISVLLICMLSGCSLKLLSSSSLEKQMSLQEELIAVVADDVRQTKDWPEGSYSIKYVTGQDAYELFFVTNLPAAEALKESAEVKPDGTVNLRTGGDGKSYTAYVNVKKKRVEKKTYVK